MRKIVCFGLFALAVAALSTGCDTKKKADTALDNANKLIEEYKRLGKNMNDTLTEMKNSAQQQAKASPASVAQVPPIPAKATGNVDITAERDGKKGGAQANIDGVGGDEEVTAFVPDQAAQGGTQQKNFTNGGDAAVFAAWKGDADSDDEGLCYLAYEKSGAAYLVVSPCGEETGAYVCQVTDDAATCSACNVSGACTPCDMEKKDFDCTWPK
jgi:hypothetical protein